MKTKDEYIDILAAELKEWSAQIDLLAVKAQHATAEMNLKYAGEVDDLRIKQHTAAAKIKELEESSGDAWGTVKETANAIWDDLRAGVASATAKFK